MVLIRAVVSLPGDAFQRSNARVKTSYLIAEKRDPKKNQEQSPIFMYPCQYIGIDDPKRQRARPGDTEARNLAEAEINTVLLEYERFRNGESTQYRVPAERATDRLDVKNCLMSPGRSIAAWQERGFRVLPLSSVVQPCEYTDDEIIGRDYPELVRVAIVRYEGIAEGGEEILPAEGSYSSLYPVRAGDIIISNIAASHGSIAVVPDDLDGCIASNEYTVLTPLPGFDPIVLQLILRSPEVRSDILLSASGANRTRTRWALIRDISIPYPEEVLVDEIRRPVREAEEAKRRAIEAREHAREQLEASLFLRTDAAATILAAFKPPK